MKTTIITEKYNADGKLIERITETTETIEAAPAYPLYPFNQSYVAPHSYYPPLGPTCKYEPSWSWTTVVLDPGSICTGGNWKALQ
jgi:hypothetical protein